MALPAAAAVILAVTCLVFRAEAGAGTVTVTSLVSPVSIAGEWKITIGDDANFAAPGYNDASWDTVTLPGTS